MNIRTPAKDLSEPKILKVSLPTSLHLQLHSHKILGGRTISETVEEALKRYLEETIGRPQQEPSQALEGAARTG